MNDRVRLDALGSRDAPPRRDALVRAGLATVGDLRRAAADGSLPGVPGLGPVGRRRVGRWLARHTPPPPPSGAAEGQVGDASPAARAADDAAGG